MTDRADPAALPEKAPMTDKLVECLKRLEQHADALMRVPCKEIGFQDIREACRMGRKTLMQTIQEESGILALGEQSALAGWATVRAQFLKLMEKKRAELEEMRVALRIAEAELKLYEEFRRDLRQYERGVSKEEGDL